MSWGHHREHHAYSAAFAIVLAGLALMLVAPGVLVMFAVDQVLGLGLDRGQLWSFGAVASAIVLFAMSATLRGAGRGFSRYLLLGAVVTAGVMVSDYGFHAAWPSVLLRRLFGNG